MTIKTHEFKLLQDYREEGAVRAEKHQQYQTDLANARARLSELQTQYEVTFTESVKQGTDATEQLTKIDDDIALQKEVVIRRERDARLAHAAMPEGKISSVDVVNEYVDVFVPKVRAEYEPIVDAKLKMARDLLISCIIDHRDGEDAYGYLREEIAEITRANRSQGKTSESPTIAHPTSTAKVMGRQGAIGGVREVINQISLFTNGHKPNDFEYIAEVPKKTKGAK
ncbi:hypothetical protein [Lysinibacillus pakistanensis]|uniref:Uncharacterized protein n=1 Tax=Lysinibacillus pakistanensis TaxID=759811 RepID=A0AAX3X4K3_9BACI|nr:hypothetical protein [Lysinibacillus pakistanensis]MDM5233505.1 hypothetical protein [Lysinibacillus pakistanensis]WHY48977.1 hypothetical protein QNH22_12360 [Lysinibacillus pakistanensis]WHY53988.1 hypothetical protein QNH24_12340 [Lysinibacillus pakistanensis]